ncbi:hypothetical protein PG993_012650 [Apiospora rasikravindrae]|uniref:Uncharacterized protein n=1 Tax=Apiospora rasikravindrae TaxID=990691 RepID=A0ABR1S327_9PEZI
MAQLGSKQRSIANGRCSHPRMAGPSDSLSPEVELTVDQCRRTAKPLVEGPSARSAATAGTALQRPGEAADELGHLIKV